LITNDIFEYPKNQLSYHESTQQTLSTHQNTNNLKASM